MFTNFLTVLTSKQELPEEDAIMAEHFKNTVKKLKSGVQTHTEHHSDCLVVKGPVGTPSKDWILGCPQDLETPAVIILKEITADPF